jgi:1,4-dihydroxy-2-naphthoate octaprenyltransferase
LLVAAYASVVLGFALGWFSWGVLLPLSTLPLAYGLFTSVKEERGTRLNRTLAGTARLLLAFGTLLGVGLVVP